MLQSKAPPLSKTRFLGGLQCLKNVYLASFSPRLADPVDVAQQAIFSMGTEVGKLARTRFPGGVLIEEPAFQLAKAVTHTSEVLSALEKTPIYEAAFETDGIRIRADIVVQNEDGSVDLVEVKSGTSVKAENIADAAVQVYVLEHAGLQVRRASLMHIDNSYVYQGGSYDVEKLFRQVDITNEVRDFLEHRLAVELSSIRDVLAEDSPPAIDIGPQCTAPYRCPYYGFCHKDEPEHSLDDLPRANANLLRGLRADGVRGIREIPLDFAGLSQLQERVRSAVNSGETYVGAGLADALHEIESPIHYLDFETFNPAVPMYEGTRPYQVIPFQWSLHILHSDGRLEHREFLHEGTDDPRPRFTSSLLDAIEDVGSIVVYSGYEQGVISKLADEYPERAGDLFGMTNRLVDLLKIVRDHFYHPNFHGSFSLKSVAPALTPNTGYSDLEIRDGPSAAAAYARILQSADDTDQLDQFRSQLLAYCERDTEVMVQAYSELLAAVERRDR